MGRVRAAEGGVKQIPCGDDNKKSKSNGNSAGEGDRRTARLGCVFAGGGGELVGGDGDVEALEEAGDALVGEAALAEEADLVAEHGDDLFRGEEFFFGAGGLAELAGGGGDLVGGVTGIGHALLECGAVRAVVPVRLHRDELRRA